MVPEWGDRDKDEKSMGLLSRMRPIPAAADGVFRAQGKPRQSGGDCQQSPNYSMRTGYTANASLFLQQNAKPRYIMAKSVR